MRTATVATLMLRVRLTDGTRAYYPAATSANGKLKPHVALVKGKPVHFPDASYYLRWTQAGGKRVTERVGDDPAQALTAKIQREHQLKSLQLGLEGPPAPVAANPSQIPTAPGSGRRELTEMVKTYVAARSANDRTGKAYRVELNQFLAIAKKRYADELTRADFRHYITVLEKAAKSPKTIVNRMTVLKAFLNFHEIDSSIVNRKDWPKVAKKLVKTYKPLHVEAILGVSSPEDRLIWEFFLGSGCREQEVSYLCWTDLDLEGKVLNIHAKPDMGFQLKDFEERSVPLPTTLVEKLKTRKLTAKGRLVFPAKNGRPEGHFLRRLKEIAYEGGLNCQHCKNRKGVACKGAAVCSLWQLHSFRRTAATRWSEKGISLQTIQKWLGHSDITTTSLYLGTQTDDATRSLIDAD